MQKYERGNYDFLSLQKKMRECQLWFTERFCISFVSMENKRAFTDRNVFLRLNRINNPNNIIASHNIWDRIIISVLMKVNTVSRTVDIMSYPVGNVF